jgi:hypothetical protein
MMHARADPSIKFDLYNMRTDALHLQGIKPFHSANIYLETSAARR